MTRRPAWLPPSKAANGATVPDVLEHRSPRLRALFERDYARASSSHPDPVLRHRLQKGGRAAVAAGWLLLYEAIYNKPRRRKGPAECHDPTCRCITHRRDHQPQVA